MVRLSGYMTSSFIPPIICEVKRSCKLRKSMLEWHEVHSIEWTGDSRKTLTSGKCGLWFRLIEIFLEIHLSHCKALLNKSSHLHFTVVRGQIIKNVKSNHDSKRVCHLGNGPYLGEVSREQKYLNNVPYSSILPYY